MELILAKIAVSIATVLGLSVLAERAGPRVAGVLSGYPLGTAILLYFIAIEQGITFASESAVYALPGLIATLTFLYVYFLVSKISVSLPVLVQIILSSCGAFTGFLAVSWVFQLAALSLPIAAVVLLIAIFVALVLFRKIENVRILNRVRLTKWVVMLRAALAAVIVLVISGLAAWIGPRWSGLLSGFPVTLYPMMLILHFTYGAEPVHTLIRNFPRGMGALWVYILAVTLGYPVLGLGWGTLCAFGAATVYLVSYSTLVWMRQKSVQADG
ncbi:hypothetical protein [Thalassospira australica]|uniref:hypothetical protein n=1 Tax=Thalassospira australica TaxID=1528106 RepID=UPI00051A5C2F|nr:hypothetical protein [Thalassospira australica]